MTLPYFNQFFAQIRKNDFKRKIFLPNIYYAWIFVAFNCYVANQMDTEADSSVSHWNWNLRLANERYYKIVGLAVNLPKMCPLLEPIALAFYKLCNIGAACALYAHVRQLIHSLQNLKSLNYCILDRSLSKNVPAHNSHRCCYFKRVHR